MRKDIHPAYHPVVYVDVGADFEFQSRSTLTSDETRTIDGVDHYVIKLEISSASHPFYTGKQHFVDTAGRIEKFRQRFGDRGSKKTDSDEQSEQTENG
jgi:large subunit ribosomal protein L31